MISAAGLPIYIYAPKYYADTYGVSLAALGTLLGALRFIDVVQDPVLGWISERLNKGKALWVSFGAFILAISMVGLFAVNPPISPIWWFAITITGLFSAFSFLTICFYAQGVTKAETIGAARNILVDQNLFPTKIEERRGMLDFELTQEKVKKKELIVVEHVN